MTTNISSLHSQQLVPGLNAVEGKSQELVDVLQRIVQNAGALLEVNNCSLALLDTTGTSLVTLAALQKHGNRTRHTRFRINEGVAGWVAENREALVIDDASLDTRFKRLGRTPIGSMACVPLMDGINFIGTLTVSSPATHAFDSKKIQILTIFAGQAASAITNARHAEQAQHQANQLEVLLDISRGITTRLDADALYRTILTALQHLIPFEIATIYQHNESTQDLYSVAELAGSISIDDSTQDIEDAVVTAKIQRETVSLYDMNSIVAWAAVHQHPMLRSTPSAIAEMATPLISKKVLYGVIALRRAEPFTSEELRLARNLSNMAVAGLENVELFHRIRSDQEQLRAILDSSSDGIAIMGANACFIEANAAFGRIFAIEPAEIVGMECMEVLGCEGEDAHDLCHKLCMVQQAIQDQHTLPYAEIDWQINGIPRSVGLSITPVSVTNKPLCLIIARDVTAIRDATRMKANFLSMITHELRSPLNAIHGYLDLALTGIAGDLNEQQQEFVQRARASSEHLYALVEDLLLVARADSGQIRLNRDVTNLQEVITSAIEELELMANDQGITVTVDLASDLPLMYADAVRLQQVLRNLINNALRFTPTHGDVIVSAHPVNNLDEDGSVLLPKAAGEKLLRLQVKDTGCGIASEYQQHIFERFYQIPHPTAGRSSGQGLGLAIVKMIVELHGGCVRVDSIPGEGSTFICLLPCLLTSDL